MSDIYIHQLFRLLSCLHFHLTRWQYIWSLQSCYCHGITFDHNRPSSDGELIYIINFDQRHGLLSTKRTTLLPPPGARRRCDCLSFYGRGQRALEEGGEDALRSPNVYMYGLHISLRSYSVACRVRAGTNKPALHARAANTSLYYGWRLECCLSHWSLNGTARLKVILRYKIKS